jgi:hypothetical protein
MRLSSMFAVVAGLTVGWVSIAQAADVKLLSSGGMKVMLTDLITSLERATGDNDWPGSYPSD